MIRSWSYRGTTICAWSHWRNPRNTSVRIAGVLPCEHVPNINLACYRWASLLVVEVLVRDPHIGKESNHIPGEERVLLIEYDKYRTQNSVRSDIHTCVKHCVHQINMICRLDSGDVSPTHGRWTPCLMQPGWQRSLQINQLSNRNWSHFPGTLAVWPLVPECRLQHYRYSVPLCLPAKLRWRVPCKLLYHTALRMLSVNNTICN